MRSLIATVVLLLVMLLATAANFVYVNTVADKLEEMVDKLPKDVREANVDEIQQLCDEWEKHAPFIGLTVGFLTVDKLTEQTHTLLACAESGDVFGYHTALTILKDAVDDMHRLEQFSVENLF